ncbi:GNAT family N-acetyltransferase [Sinosporangium siamense]|uniref:Uncharacterized protein n=1 Tax=Sinosporangium siamense TaxID=1367973 RepID=A0A919RF43_9ACTN|nr:GNAT family protein [Sinosporangium siamense]GII90731.1 hypothetical protein Ssi02_09620 [Sinosporangium siamense]
MSDKIDPAFGELDLHRLQAETLLHNTASQYGMAPSYLKIAGSWQDHILFHLLAED